MNKVIHGDCLGIMPTLPDKSIDMILCDLPYGITRNTWDSIIPLKPLWGEYMRIIKKNGVIALTAATPFSIVLGHSNIGWLKYEWIWDKRLGSGSLNAKKQPLKRHENILVFYDNAPTYNPQMKKGRYRNKSTSSPDGNKGNYGKIKHIRDNYNDNYYPTTIIEDFTNADMKNRLHPTQKPVALFEYLIKTYTNEGETVLDNCAGSGTTAIACLNTNRNYILIEKEKEYIDIINKRIAEHEIQVSIC